METDPLSEDERPPDPMVTRAILRLQEIARVLGRPVADFFEPDPGERSETTAEGAAVPPEGG